MAASNSYDFDRVTDRQNTHSQKWDKYSNQDIIPLWVADTDFKVAPVIQTAIEEVIQIQEQSAKQKGVDLNFKLENFRMPEISSDKQRLQ